MKTTRFALATWGALIALALIALPAAAQQSGSVGGIVTAADGSALPGVTVSATGDTLPGSRTTITGSNGRYRLLRLPPGNYTIEYALDGMETVSREVRVVLDQNIPVNVTLAADAIEETLVVIGTAPVIDLTSNELKAAVDSDVIQQLPVGQQYRDLLKLIPGVQYSEDTVRGPSAGGNGQDNVYQFDGVDVGLPLFGVLSAEPASVDIEQVSIVKGGAKATDFNRSGGFLVDTVSKSGTNEYHGSVSYQVQTAGMTGDQDVTNDAEFEQDLDWTTANFGGPIAQDKAHFYLSYFRPTVSRDNRANLYGDVPDFDSTRDELFGKVTLTPTDSTLFNLSYRDSDRESEGAGVSGEATTGTASTGSEATLGIGIVEGTWVVSNNGFLSGKYTNFENETSGRPDNLLPFDIRDDGSVGLDVNNLDQMGLFAVPVLSGDAGFDAGAQALIDRYGFLQGGVREGGGLVGAGTTINDQDFYRDAFEINYDHSLFAGDTSHDLHFGYMWSRDGEDLSRTSNGWGLIQYIGGNDQLADGTPVFYEARFEQQGLLSAGGVAVPPINSEFETQSFEINDTIRLQNWTINVGVLVSNDQLFGEGLRPNSSNLSGFELAPGNQYKMYEIDWDEMIQPRIGIARELFDGDSAYVNFARYNPAAGSLPRAASWARNLRRTIDAQFDADGNLIGLDPVRSSSGKYFDDDLDPRFIDEYLIGYNAQFSPRFTGKFHTRYRYAANFWEDTNNNARSRFRPPAGIPTEDYIPNLSDFRAEIGGSSYVIAELDNAFTKYYEVNAELEHRGDRTFVRGSYVWSHYYGNFDQDNTTTSNDAATFIGSSFLADGAGRQIWDNRYGNLRGDRRHQLKVYGTYAFNWNGTAGAYAIYQSGQPWEAWDVNVYRDLTGSSSSTSRFAEPAGSRTTSDHYQVDLNYTHNFPIGDRYRIEVRADLFNALDEQTGYNIQNQVTRANFGTARDFFLPRRLQLQARFLF